MPFEMPGNVAQGVIFETIHAKSSDPNYGDILQYVIDNLLTDPRRLTAIIQTNPHPNVLSGIPAAQRPGVINRINTDWFPLAKPGRPEDYSGAWWPTLQPIEKVVRAGFQFAARPCTGGPRCATRSATGDRSRSWPRRALRSGR